MKSVADLLNRSARSRLMSRVKNKNTAPELAIRKALFANGLKGYRVHRKDIIGQPDVAWIGKRIAIFVDGAFWHGHPSAYKKGQSGVFWDQKIERNKARDIYVVEQLKMQGWVVIRFWDFEIEKSLSTCIDRVRKVFSSLEARQ